MKSGIVVALSIFLGWSTAFSHGDGDGHGMGFVRVEQAWARPSPPMVKNGVVYLRLKNRSNKPDRLLGVSTPVAKRAELHEHQMKGGMAMMRPVEGIDVPPGALVSLHPGGLHIMLFDLHEPLKAGQHFPLSLELTQSGRIEAEVEVREMEAHARKPKGGHHGMH